MIEKEEFKDWLGKNTNYSEASVSDVLSRMKRADNLLAWGSVEPYAYYLEQEEHFSEMSVSVKSQIRKAVKLYSRFYKDMYPDYSAGECRKV